MLAKVNATPQVLAGNTRDYKDPTGLDLLTRTRSFFDWQQARKQSGYLPYSRSLEAAPQASTQIKDCRGQARLFSYGARQWEPFTDQPHPQT